MSFVENRLERTENRPRSLRKLNDVFAQDDAAIQPVIACTADLDELAHHLPQLVVFVHFQAATSTRHEARNWSRSRRS